MYVTIAALFVLSFAQVQYVWEIESKIPPSIQSRFYTGSESLRPGAMAQFKKSHAVKLAVNERKQIERKKSAGKSISSVGKRFEIRLIAVISNH